MDAKTFGARLHAARLRQGWRTRREAAARIGVDEKSLRAWECGRWLPSLAVFAEILDALPDVEPGWLLGRE